MSKAGKAKKADFRQKEKRRRKEQQRSLYESYKAAGTNKKSKRGTIKAKRVRMVQTKKHVSGNCGNAGCSKQSCFPHLAPIKMNHPNDLRSRYVFGTVMKQSKKIAVDFTKSEIQDKIDNLNTKLGNNIGATHERAKLAEQLKIAI